MDAGSSSPSRQSPHPDDRDAGPPTSKGGATGLYRAPTWARNINFDSNFDLNSQGSPSLGGGYALPPDGATIGLALGDSPQQEEQRHFAANPEGNGTNSFVPADGDAPSHLRNSSAGSGQPVTRSRQTSNSPGTPLKNSPTLTQSERSTPKAAQRPTMSPMLQRDHQRVASASSGSGSFDWSRPSGPAQLHSSADLYAQPMLAHTAGSSRPGTSMSMLSASVDDSKDHRRDSYTSAGVNKRGSVLSFQTALSGVGGYASNEESNQGGPSKKKSVGGAELEELDDTLPPRPWLMQGGDLNPSVRSSTSSSPDDRHFPGGWGGPTRTWNQSAEGLVPLGNNASMAMDASQPTNRTPSRSPQLRLATLDDSGHQVSQSRSSSGGEARTSPRHSRTGSPSASPLQESKGIRSQSMLRNETTTELQLSPARIDAMSPTSGQSTMHGAQSNLAAVDTAPPLGTDEARPSQTRPDASPPQPQLSSGKERREEEDEKPTTGSRQSSSEMPSASLEKPASPVNSGKDELGLSSPPLSDNVIPPPLPSEVSNIPAQMPADRSPVSDFRQKPLAKMSVDDPVHQSDDEDEEGEEMVAAEGQDLAETKASPSPASHSPVMYAARSGAGVGAHAARNSVVDQTNAAPAFAALMRRPSDGPSRVAMAAVSTPPPNDRSPSPSIETPPREASPPPEGEVEARAEWERAQMRQMADRDKQAGKSSRKTTFRTQLKPLQLVAAEESKRTGRNSPGRNSQGGTPFDSPVEEVRAGMGDMALAANARQGTEGMGAGGLQANPVVAPSPQLSASNGKGGTGLSTQQLQRQLARDQRRSVSAVNMTMGQMGVSDIGGAYPVFSSPSTSATNGPGGMRQYSGLMPQRSLVPPFELQNRPDGLPSALIGPDGTRKNPNDPEVCLECMMRDEDMIDVHVLGAGLWERESDRDFEEAIRVEGEDDARRERAKSGEGNSNGTHGGGTLEGAGGEGEGGSTSKDMQPSLPLKPRLTKMRVKRVAKGEPLTADRLKFHTQMNPPASSHRWKTLQTFLAVQEKYIAIEKRARANGPAVPPKMNPTDGENRMVRTQSGDSKTNHRQRAASPGLFKVAEAESARPDESSQAREARRRNNTSGPEMRRGGVEGEGAAKRLSGPPLPNDDSSGHQSIPRRSKAAGPATFARAGSAQDLRSVPNAMATKGEMQRPMGESLAPPNAPFRGPSSPSTPGGRMRTVSSQLSLAGSGSMVDMHLGLEDRKEHRISQAGFIPGTPIHSQSPSALNRAYYGFPGDGDGDGMDEWDQSRQLDQSFGHLDDSYAGSATSPEADRRKKKSGIRGFFNKISGKEASSGAETGRMTRQEGEWRGDESNRRLSLGPDSAMNLQPPPGMAGLLSKARRSTSSLLSPSGRQSMDSTTMLGERNMIFNNSPLMTSQTSLELGPFGSGPLPPPRKDSRFSRAPSPRPASPEKTRLRTFSSGNLLGRKKVSAGAPLPSPSSRSSSIILNSMGQNQRTSSNGGLAQSLQSTVTTDREAGDRSSTTSRLSYRKELPVLPGGSHTRSPSYPMQSGSHPMSPSVSNSMQASPLDASVPRLGAQPPLLNSSPHPPPHHLQSRQLATQRGNRSEGLQPPGDGLAEHHLNQQQGQSTDSAGAPKRPPRSPHRDFAGGRTSSDQQLGSVDGVLYSANSAAAPSLHIPPSLQKEQFYHQAANQTARNEAGSANGPPSAQQQQRQQEADRYSAGGMIGSSSPLSFSPPTPTPNSSSRKSRLLKLPFGKNKRESVATVKSNPTSLNDTPSLRSRSSRGTLDDASAFAGIPPAAGQSTHAGSLQPGFDSLRGGAGGSNGWPDERSRFNGTNSSDDRGLPPRSNSAMGMFDGSPSSQSGNSSGMRGFLPRLRTNSRAALRDVKED